ncbi:hypothetical protein J2M53_00060 [Arthrobacter sp. zg-ZUI100]|uniref:hypothetical protein n=1 Tax=Arthrobacter jiangjiafuii TaxID=2817475 RepID=UPI001AEE5FA2|nr:hypothetical protein [Arthrobacter jiangjiafuii]MBP3034649.1 hypothetical protein [Arthrobacter jiangjiafuii]
MQPQAEPATTPLVLDHGGPAGGRVQLLDDEAANALVNGLVLGLTAVLTVARG